MGEADGGSRQMRTEVNRAKAWELRMATSYLGCLGKTLAILTPPASPLLAQQVHRTKEVYRGTVPAGRGLHLDKTEIHRPQASSHKDQYELDRHRISGLFLSSVRP